MNKKILGSGLLLVGILLLVALILPGMALAQQSLAGMVDTLAGNLQALGGSLAIIGFIVAGIMYISSTANPSNMSLAKGALVAAVIGIIILLLAPMASDFVSGLFGIGS